MTATLRVVVAPTLCSLHHSIRGQTLPPISLHVCNVVESSPQIESLEAADVAESLRDCLASLDPDLVVPAARRNVSVPPTVSQCPHE